MKLFRKEEVKNTVEIPSRVKNMDKSSLLTWFDTSIMGLGGSFDKWRFHGGEPEQVTEALTALNVIWEELQQRVDK